VILHTRGNSLVFSDYTYEEFVDLFHQINQDAENRVIILTGAGEAFIDRIDAEGFDFYSPHGEGARVQGTVAAIERWLLRGGFVLRYDTAATEDGPPPGEGTFLPSSFWLADAYVMIGRAADAERLFERLVNLCNDGGLLAEEYDVSAQRQLGNFPQAFSHIALVNTAYNVGHATKPCEQRSGHKRVRASAKRSAVAGTG
jgi:glycosyl hydrolase family 15